MSQFNSRAVVIRTNTNHGLRCTPSEEQHLVRGLNLLLEQAQFGQAEISALVASLPTSFLSENDLDSAEQYARLLWSALQSSDMRLTGVASVTNVTNFNGSVHTQVLQTGSHSTTQIAQSSHYNQAFSNQMLQLLEKISDTAENEITNKSEQAAVLALVEEAKSESVKPDPNPKKMTKILKGLGKWTGDRFTNAVDAAIECAINYAAKGGS